MFKWVQTKLLFLTLMLVVLEVTDLSASAQCLPLFTKTNIINPKDFPSIAKELQSSPIKSMIPLGDYLRSLGFEYSGHNEKVTFLVEFESGTRGIFKATKDIEPIIGEVSAYIISEYLGLHFVPPTVARTINGQKGSLQYFVEWSLTEEKKSFIKRWENLSATQRASFKLLYFVIGQWDRHNGNMLASSDGQVLMIDNEHIMDIQKVIYGEMPFLRRGKWVPYARNMIFGESFPFHKTSKLTNPTKEELWSFFGNILNEEALNLAWTRLEEGKYPNKEITYVFWNNSLWIQRHPGRFGPDYTEFYPPQTMDAFRKMNFNSLRKILPKEYHDSLIHYMLERRDQVLSAYIKSKKE